MRVLERILLVRPSRVLANLERARRAGLVEEPPNPWQLCLAVLRLWHRVLLRSDTVGTSQTRPVRPTLRARLLHYRGLRLPCLLAERALAPLDFTGLLSSPERITRHLLGAYHDADEFFFDLEILSLHEGKLEELARRVRAVVEGTDQRAEWLRDLAVFDGYHEDLLRAAEVAARAGVELEPAAADDPDLTLSGLLRWSARQPSTPGATLRAWRRGRFSFASSEPPLPRAPLRAGRFRRA